MAEVKIEERGWAGHYICSRYCSFRRNTLISYGDKKWVVSTVGGQTAFIDIPSCGIKEGDIQQVGAGRYYETQAFVSKGDEYDDADVEHPIHFESNWGLFTESWEDLEKEYPYPDLAANEMHNKVVEELSERIKL